MKDMLDKILQIEKKYKELGETLSDPAVIQDYNRFRDLSKQRKAMEETVNLYYEWKTTTEAIEDAKQMLHEEKDEEMRQFLKSEIETNEAKLCCYLVTLWMTKISCWKSAVAQVVMKQTFSQVI